MKKFFAICLLFSFTTSLFSQNVTFDFENLSMPDTGFWNGADSSVYNHFYGNEYLHFENNYESQYFWSGFAFSNWGDTLSNDYSNQWSVYSQAAHSGSVFGLAYIKFDWQAPFTHTFAQIIFQSKVKLDSLFLTNSTYTALTIKNGSSYSNPFSTANQDYYKIVMYFINGNDTIDTLEHFLADYRTIDSVVVKNWQKVDLTAVDSVTKIAFDAKTTDIGTYGPNTPLYFCIDDIYFNPSPSNLQNTLHNTNLLTIYPNPAADFIVVNNEAKNVSIYDINGKLVIKTQSNYLNTPIDVSNLSNGLYFVTTQSESGLKTAKFVKK